MIATKKGEVGDISGIMAMGASVAVGFVVFIVCLTLGGSLLAAMNTSLTNGTTSAQILQNGSAGILQVSNQTTTMGLVIGIVIVLLILVGGLGVFLYTRKE